LAEHAHAEETVAQPEPVEHEEEAEDSEAVAEPEDTDTEPESVADDVPETPEVAETEEPVEVEATTEAVAAETEDYEAEDAEEEEKGETGTSENDIEEEPPVLAPPSKRPTPPNPDDVQTVEEQPQPTPVQQAGVPTQVLERRPAPPQLPVIVDDNGPRRCSEVIANTDSSCHRDGECVDYSPGYCCQCLPGYYGNGKECLKDGRSLVSNVTLGPKCSFRRSATNQWRVQRNDQWSRYPPDGIAHLCGHQRRTGVYGAVADSGAARTVTSATRAGRWRHGLAFR
jgi:hypothetical protein